MNLSIANISQTRKAGKSAVMTESDPERIKPEQPPGPRDKSVLFCESCYRYDKHIPVKIAPVFKILLVIITAGLALIFWPKRCSCCGSVRF